MLELIKEALIKLNEDLEKVESELSKVEQLKRIKYELSIKSSLLKELLDKYEGESSAKLIKESTTEEQ